MRRPFLLIIVVSLLLGGCARAPGLPQEPAPSAFVIERALAGSTVARGEFSAINGVRRGFTAYLEGVLLGSGKLATELDRLDLIDEYKFLVHPRIAGHGPTLRLLPSRRVHSVGYAAMRLTHPARSNSSECCHVRPDHPARTPAPGPGKFSQRRADQRGQGGAS